MKKVSKWMALFTALIFVFSLCGCGNGGSGKSIAGTWEAEWDMSEVMADEMGDEFADFESTLVVSLLFDFNEDGTYKIYLNEDKFKTGIANWTDDLCDYAVEKMYDTFETESGVDRETADSLIYKQYGMTIDEMMRQQIDLLFNVDAFIASVETKGVYETKGNKLFLGDEGEVDRNRYDTFTVTGDTLKLEVPKGAASTPLASGLEYPITLYKVK